MTPIAASLTSHVHAPQFRDGALYHREDFGALGDISLDVNRAAPGLCRDGLRSLITPILAHVGNCDIMSLLRQLQRDLASQAPGARRARDNRRVPVRHCRLLK